MKVPSCKEMYTERICISLNSYCLANLPVNLKEMLNESPKLYIQGYLIKKASTTANICECAKCIFTVGPEQVSSPLESVGFLWRGVMPRTILCTQLYVKQDQICLTRTATTLPTFYILVTDIHIYIVYKYTQRHI